MVGDGFPPEKTSADAGVTQRAVRIRLVLGGARVACDASHGPRCETQDLVDHGWCCSSQSPAAVMEVMIHRKSPIHPARDSRGSAPITAAQDSSKGRHRCRHAKAACRSMPGISIASSTSLLRARRARAAGSRRTTCRDPSLARRARIARSSPGRRTCTSAGPGSVRAQTSRRIRRTSSHGRWPTSFATQGCLAATRSTRSGLLHSRCRYGSEAPAHQWPVAARCRCPECACSRSRCSDAVFRVARRQTVGIERMG